MRGRPVLALLVALAACRDRGPAMQAPSVEPPETSREGSASAALATPALSGAPAGFEPQRVTDDGRGVMGTHLTMIAFTTPSRDEGAVRRGFDAAAAEIARIEALMTTWRADSEVSRINAAAGKSPVVVGQETFDVIAAALHTSEISGGTFDITFEGLHGLWKFDEDLDPHPPTDAQIKARLPMVGYHHAHLDPQQRSVYLDAAGVKIGLGGIAKGYAVDRAAKVLVDAGIEAFILQAGGDLITHGRKPDGAPWSAGIRDPRGAVGAYFALLDVTDHAFSTAGDYERSYIVAGKRYHHIIDPHTGKPATASRSVTIWAPTALEADEIDDAVFILGPEKGLALVESLDGVGAVIVDAKNRLWVSKRLEGKLKVIAPPTDGV